MTRFVLQRFRGLIMPLTCLAIVACAAPARADEPVPVLANPNPLLDPISAYIASLPEIKRAALASQPSWVSPIVTTTARLEQNLRYEQTQQDSANGSSVSNFDNGKGARFILGERFEIQANPPPIERRTVSKPGTGTGDWQFTSLRYRIASANAENGDYVLTVYSNFQAPTGSTLFTNNAWVFTPSIAAGKGWGAFDIQANASLQVPGSHYTTIGDVFVGNIAFQYHLGEYFWPQFEVNTNHYIGGQRSGRTTVYLTPGILFGRFALTPENNLTFGIGYQRAVAPSKTITKPVLTPAYDDALILASRLSF